MDLRPAWIWIEFGSAKRLGRPRAGAGLVGTAFRGARVRTSSAIGATHVRGSRDLRHGPTDVVPLPAGGRPSRGEGRWLRRGAGPGASSPLGRGVAAGWGQRRPGRPQDL